MVEAVVDTSILIADGADDEIEPDLTGFTALHVSSISYSELAGGIAVATGVIRARRQARYSHIQRVYGEGLPFDDDCVREYLLLTELVVAAGRSHRTRVVDRMIAATARAHDMTVITRNLADFQCFAGMVAVVER